MNHFNRAVVILLACILLLGGVFIITALGGWVHPGDLERLSWLRPVLEQVQAEPLTAGVAGAVSGLIGLLLLLANFVGFRRGPEVLIQRSKAGSTRVSLVGMRRLAEYVVGGVAGVDAVAAQVRLVHGRVAFRCRILVQPETSLPDLEQVVRDRLALSVQNHIGQATAETRIDLHTQVVPPDGARKRLR